MLFLFFAVCICFVRNSICSDLETDVVVPAVSKRFVDVMGVQGHI